MHQIALKTWLVFGVIQCISRAINNFSLFAHLASQVSAMLFSTNIFVQLKQVF